MNRKSILLKKQRIISDAEKVIDRLGEEVLAKGIARTLTAEELKLVEEKKAGRVAVPQACGLIVAPARYLNNRQSR